MRAVLRYIMCVQFLYTSYACSSGIYHVRAVLGYVKTVQCQDMSYACSFKIHHVHAVLRYVMCKQFWYTSYACSSGICHVHAALGYVICMKFYVRSVCRATQEARDHVVCFRNRSSHLPKKTSVFKNTWWFIIIFNNLQGVNTREWQK